MLTDFDRDRIEQDLEQLAELIERKQVLWDMESDPERKDQLAAEMAGHAEVMAALKAQLT